MWLSAMFGVGCVTCCITGTVPPASSDSGIPPPQPNPPQMDVALSIRPCVVWWLSWYNFPSTFVLGNFVLVCTGTFPSTFDILAYFCNYLRYTNTSSNRNTTRNFLQTKQQEYMRSYNTGHIRDMGETFLDALLSRYHQNKAYICQRSL